MNGGFICTATNENGGWRLLPFKAQGTEVRIEDPMIRNETKGGERRYDSILPSLVDRYNILPR